MKCLNLEVWQRSKAVCVSVYKSTCQLNDFGFRDQLTRSSLSVPSNNAEGLERRSEKEKIKFLDIARASCAEAQTQIMIGTEIGYLNEQQANLWLQELEAVGKMLSGLINSIKRNLTAKD